MHKHRLLTIMILLLLAGCASHHRQTSQGLTLDEIVVVSPSPTPVVITLPDQQTARPAPSPSPSSPAASDDSASKSTKKKASAHAKRPIVGPVEPTQPNRSPASTGKKSASDRPEIMRATESEYQAKAANNSGSAATALDNLPSAKAVVSHPDPMLKYHEETVTVSVSLDMQQNLDQPTTPEMAAAKQQMLNTPLAVKGSPFMRVDIQETDDFKIRYLGPADQRMQSVGKDPAQWPFGVTPLTSTLRPEDTKTLHITVTNYASENAKAGRILLKQDEAIHVHVRAMDQLVHTIQDNWSWKWLWTTIIVPIWAYLKRRLKGQPEPKLGSDEPEKKKANVA